ncbi:hypothetical protein Mal64_27430 [Pseudobythopirellula maris]|uniref:Uncharacterized protein n=1 Tax=Pseudobythopirellula maris TaxID=2527991 RepID=A0A5C5ZJA6_9BACT|nr:hypothetical protein [Pseudobythopirellula maris]TWT87205.1 hypothetical protein Mal64_27430 [Pseudobythopirellula maris]
MIRISEQEHTSEVSAVLLVGASPHQPPTHVYPLAEVSRRHCTLRDPGHVLGGSSGLIVLTIDGHEHRSMVRLVAYEDFSEGRIALRPLSRSDVRGKALSTLTHCPRRKRVVGSKVPNRPQDSIATSPLPTDGQLELF